MASRGKQTLVQRIALDGGKEIQAELKQLGTIGQVAFDRLKVQAERTSIATTGFTGKLVELRKGVDVLGTRLTSLGGRFSFLTGEIGRVAGVVLGALSVRALVDMTSAWTDLNSRLRQSLGDHTQVGAVMERLQEIARRTYSSLETSVDSFARNSVVLRELGYNTDKVLDFQEALNNALVVSGARGDRLRQVQDAVNKTMSTGRFEADALNSVLSYGGRIAQLLAEKFGVTTGELRNLATQGVLTGKVLGEVLVENLATLRAEAEAMPATIQDAFILLNNALLSFVGGADQATGVSAAIAEALIWVADNIDIVVIGLGLLVGGFLAVKTVGLAIELFGIAKALVGLIAPLSSILLLMATNPFGLAAIAISGLILVIVQATGGFENLFRLISEYTPLVLAQLTALVTPVTDFIGAVIGAIKTFLIWAGLMGEETKEGEAALQKVNDVVKDTESSLSRSTVAVTGLGKATEKAATSMETSFDGVTDSVTNTYSAFDGLLWRLSGGVERAKALYSALQSVGGSSGSFQTLSGGGADSIQGLAGGGAIKGPGTSTSDSVLARLSRGEYVVRAAAVRKYGPGLLNALNSMRLPGFAEGGGLNMPRMNIGGLSGLAVAGPSGRPFNLTIGGETFEGLIAPETVADHLIRFAGKRTPRQAGRKPSWLTK